MREQKNGNLACESIIGGDVSLNLFVVKMARRQLMPKSTLKMKTTRKELNCGNPEHNFLSNTIDGAEEVVGSCTWKEKTSINQNTRGNLLNVFSQIPIGGLVSPC